MSLIALDYIVGMMIEDLSRSADLMVEQIFEEMRVALVQRKGDVPSVLKKSESLAKLLDSTQAFGPAVVGAYIVAPDGTVIVSAHGEAEGKKEPAMPSMSELEALTSRWWLFASIPRTERLTDVIDGPLFHGLDRTVQRRISGHDDDIRRGAGLLDGFQELNSVQIGHAEIRYHEFKRLFFCGVEGFQSVRFRYSLIPQALQYTATKSSNDRFIIYH